MAYRPPGSLRARYPLHAITRRYRSRKVLRRGFSTNLLSSRRTPEPELRFNPKGTDVVVKNNGWAGIETARVKLHHVGSVRRRLNAETDHAAALSLVSGGID